MLLFLGKVLCGWVGRRAKVLSTLTLRRRAKLRVQRHVAVLGLERGRHRISIPRKTCCRGIQSLRPGARR